MDNEKEQKKISLRATLELILAVYKMSFLYLAIFILAIAAVVWLFSYF